MMRRSRALWSRDQQKEMTERPEPIVTTTFQDSMCSNSAVAASSSMRYPGARRSTRCVVWMPHERIVFTGNLTGPLFGHVPNLYTLRGDKIRYVQWFIDGVQRVIDLRPELLITGHGEPVKGREEICRQLSRIRDATQYLRDRTFEGMNAGLDLWTLMGAIELRRGLPSDRATARYRGSCEQSGRSISAVSLRIDHGAV